MEDQRNQLPPKHRKRGKNHNPIPTGAGLWKNLDKGKQLTYRKPSIKEAREMLMELKIILEDEQRKRITR